MDDTAAILERINDALRERALTQVELAEQTGLSTTARCPGSHPPACPG